MLYQLPKTIQLFFLILFSTFLYSQEGTITGVLNGNDGYPLPGVNVIIKNSKVGTATDFDGAYKIKCKVGDILEFSSVGMKTKEVFVTIDMFQEDSKDKVKMIPAKNIKSEAYLNAIKKSKRRIVIIPNIESSEHIYNNDKNNYFNNYHRTIKNIAIDSNSVKLTHFNANIFFEIGYNTSNGFKFIKKNNLPELQNTYSQGTSFNGDLIFQGPETGTVFSYGPKISNLEFDGSNYQYDTNGKLVPLGSGNGSRAKSYNNTIFDTSLKTSHHLFFNISTSASFFGFDYTYKTEKDLYNVENNSAQLISLKYKNNGDKKIGWDTFVKYTNLLNKQTNINGFQNNLLLNSWATPTTFNTNEGYVLSDGTQRSFSPTRYNNPNWLLSENNNSEKNTAFVASLKNTFKLNGDVKLATKLNYKNTKSLQFFGLPKNTVGFENGYFSDRNVTKNNFNGSFNFKYDKYSYANELIINSNINYNRQSLAYQLTEFNDLNNANFTTNKQSLIRDKFRLSNNARYIFDDIGLILFLGNNSYISSIQNDKWFLPTLQVKLQLHNLLDIYPITKLSIYSSSTIDVNDSKLLYNNQSHNSLHINPTESLQYLATNDLFLDSTLKLEEKENYEIGLDAAFRLLGASFTFNATHFNTKTKNVVFPVLENNEFQLKNTAIIKNRGIEAELGFNRYSNRGLNYSTSITFSKNKATVLELTDNIEQIPIAGFSTISKNLIVGETAGVIVGSAYERDENNRVVIGEDGFPLVADKTKIIGDPTPKFNLGFSNNFRWKDLELDFVIDVQKGGDIWNGTQNVLNYFGVSQQSATEREITNHVFNGVNQLGEENTIPVDFYNPENDISENKFVRNGFEGVAEDAIVDGSYINLKSVSLSYQPIKNERNQFIRDLKISIYGSNLFTWSKFKGASPYSSLYGNSSATGLNFFNAPLISEIGFKINIKI